MGTSESERSTKVGWTIIDRTKRIIEPIEPTTDGPGGLPVPPDPPPLLPPSAIRTANFSAKIFKRPKNREDGSDFDDFWTV